MAAHHRNNVAAFSPLKTSRTEPERLVTAMVETAFLVEAFLATTR
jgi:hypothetical protein